MADFHEPRLTTLIMMCSVACCCSGLGVSVALKFKQSTRGTSLVPRKTSLSSTCWFISMPNWYWDEYLAGRLKPSSLYLGSLPLKRGPSTMTGCKSIVVLPTGYYVRNSKRDEKKGVLFLNVSMPFDRVWYRHIIIRHFMVLWLNAVI